MKNELRDKLRNYLPFLLVIFSVGITFIPSLINGEALYWGTASLQFIPWRALAWETFANGQLPLWNPYNGMGSPLIANYQLAFYYPPNWLQLPFYLSYGVTGLAISHTILVVLHLISAGSGMVVLLREKSIGTFGQTIGGLAFSLCFYVIARVSFFSIIWTVSWLPWIFVLLMRLTIGEEISLFSNQIRKNLVLLIIAFSMMLLAGHAQTAWYVIMLSGIWMLYHVFTSRNDKKRFILIGVLLFAIVISFFISGIQLIPTYEYLRESQRAILVERDYALTYSFWPWRFLTFFLPFLFGSPVNGSAWGYGNFWEDAVYFGLWPLLLSFISVFGLLQNKQKYSREILFSGSIIILGSLLALGKNTIIFPFLYDHIPTFNLFQAPSRFMLWTVFGFALLSGFGGELLEQIEKINIRKFFIVIICFSGIGAASLFAKLFIDEIPASLWISTLIFSGEGIIGGLIIVFWKSSSSYSLRNISKGLFLFLVITDLIWTNHGLNKTFNWDFYDGLKVSYNPTNAKRAYISPSDEYDLKFNRFFRVQDFRLIESLDQLKQINLPNINIFNNFEMVNNFDPLVPSRFSYLLEQLEEMDPIERIEWLKMMNIKDVEIIDINTTLGIRKEEISKSSRFHWFNCAMKSSSSQDSWFKTNDELKKIEQFKRYAIIEQLMDDDPIANCEENILYTIKVVDENVATLILDVQSENAGWLIVSDVWYPGWKASIDGKPIELYRANFIFRGIEIPHGKHRIEIWYAPISTTLGIYCSILGIFFLLLVSFLRKKQDLE